MAPSSNSGRERAQTPAPDSRVSPPPEMDHDSDALEPILDPILEEEDEDMMSSTELLERIRAFQSSHEKSSKPYAAPPSKPKNTAPKMTPEELAVFNENMFSSDCPELVHYDSSELGSEQSGESLSSSLALRTGGASILRVHTSPGLGAPEDDKKAQHIRFADELLVQEKKAGEASVYNRRKRRRRADSEERRSATEIKRVSQSPPTSPQTSPQTIPEERRSATESKRMSQSPQTTPQTKPTIRIRTSKSVLEPVPEGSIFMWTRP